MVIVSQTQRSTRETSARPRKRIDGALLWVALLLGAVLFSAVPGLQAQASDPLDEAAFWDAARVGNLAAVRSAVEAGIDVAAADRWSGTALFKAAAAGRTEVVSYLLEQKANANVQESFWGQSALSAALGDGHFEVAAQLLAAGAEGREDAFGFAVMRGAEAETPERFLALARAAVESGPFFASARDRLIEQSPPTAYAELLDRAKTRPDPPAPELSAADLEPYAGIYEGWSDDQRIVAAVREGRLTVAIDGAEPLVLEATAENAFATSDGALRVSYFGRAGSVEGIFLGGSMEGALRRSVAEPVTDAPTDVAARSTDAQTPVRRTANWPSFRGPNGDGIGDGEPAPESWNLETGENVRWVAALEGLGNSSPVIWGDRVYITTAVAQGIEQEVTTGDTGSGADVDESVEHSWQVIALDARSGKRLWTTEVGRGVPKTRRHFKGSQANSTPVTDGQHVVVVFPTAGLAALDPSGKILWHHDLGPLNASNFFDPDDQWGFASSPILVDGKVILQVDVFGGGYLAAWDVKTGKELWKTERDTASSWATPTLLRGEERDELIVNASSIRGYDPETGEQLWSLGPNSELVIARPVVSDGVAYVSAGYPPVKPVYAIRAGLRGDLEVKPGEEHGALLWSHRVGGAYMPSPLLYKGLLYVVHHNGRIVAYDAETGAARYKKRFSRGGTFTGSPVVNNGRLYVPTEGGLMYVLAAGPIHEEIAVNDFDEPLMATPAIAAGVLYVRTPGHLYALSKAANGADK
ncbi:MAG: PQQ-binding-like beta-propeller repeat protein [Acidobacteriota bacterium]